MIKIIRRDGKNFSQKNYKTKSHRSLNQKYVDAAIRLHAAGLSAEKLVVEWKYLKRPENQGLNQNLHWVSLQFIRTGRMPAVVAEESCAFAPLKSTVRESLALQKKFFLAIGRIGVVPPSVVSSGIIKHIRCWLSSESNQTDVLIGCNIRIPGNAVITYLVLSPVLLPSRM